MDLCTQEMDNSHLGQLRKEIFYQENLIPTHFLSKVVNRAQDMDLLHISTVNAIIKAIGHKIRQDCKWANSIHVWQDQENLFFFFWQEQSCQFCHRGTKARKVACLQIVTHPPRLKQKYLA